MKRRFWRSAQPSLQGSLLRWLLTPLVLLIPLSAALIYMLALSPALDGLDRALTGTAVALAQVLETQGDAVTLPLSDQTTRALQADLVDQTFFAVGDPEGRLLGGSAALLSLAPKVQAGQWRFLESTVLGLPVRVAVHGVACGAAADRACPIVVAETLGKRNAARQSVLFASLLGALALALPMALLAMTAVGRGMRPLRLAAADVASRTPDRLEPIQVAAVPRELLPFVAALNGLFGRLRDAAHAQRAFVADAAHQLRTPLAVLHVEAAEALSSPHPPALRPVLERLNSAAERGARLAQQLLALARAEEATFDAARPAAPLDLARVAEDAADRWLRPSLQAGQDLGFDLAPAWTQGDAVLVAELLGNLIHNAIQHAGAGAAVTVRTRTLGPVAQLCVEDDGCGSAVAEPDTLWQRFRRGQGGAGGGANAGGSGLGLAIVQDIARLHGARAELTTGGAGRGFRVCIDFPAHALTGAVVEH